MAMTFLASSVMAPSCLEVLAHISFADLGGTLRSVVGSSLQKAVNRQFSDVVEFPLELVDVIVVARACSTLLGCCSPSVGCTLLFFILFDGAPKFFLQGGRPS